MGGGQILQSIAEVASSSDFAMCKSKTVVEKICNKNLIYWRYINLTKIKWCFG